MGAPFRCLWGVFMRSIDTGIYLYFGLPRSGKSCHAVIQARKYLKMGFPVYANFPIKGCYLIDSQDIGKYLFQDCLIIIDESGVDFDNRRMNINPDQIYFFKYHGHYRCKCLFYSQSTDTDKKIRTMAVCHYEIKKSVFPNVSFCKRIDRKIGIDEMTHQETEMFYYVPWYLGGVTPVFRRKAYPYFDTHTRKALPTKEFELVETEFQGMEKNKKIKQFSKRIKQSVARFLRYCVHRRAYERLFRRR